jgi:hypothetical protein
MTEYLCRLRRLGAAVVFCVAALLPAPVQADDAEPRVEAGQCVSPAGTLLRRERADKAWHLVAPNETVHSRDTLLALPGARAVVEPRPNSVTLTLWGNLPQLSSFNGLQSEVVLHDTKAFDLDFTPVRGRLVVRNTKARGPAKVWLRLPGEGWQLTLANPGDEAALELYSRWPYGVSFRREPRPGETPTGTLLLLVLKGQVELKTPAAQLALAAPPGAALFEWDSAAGADSGPQSLKQLPAWADPKAKPPEEEALVGGIVQRLQGRLKEQAPGDALADLLAAADRDADPRRAALTRTVAVLSLGALDDLTRVADALADGKHAETRDAAVTALRHWIGGGAGRDAKLYRLLIEHSRLSAAQAETVLQLLHSPFAADQPETYETLLAYLEHGQLAVRELARWHLYRLAPAGRDIKYDAAAAEAERTKGVEAWKKLIPRGQLPPKEKPKP